MKNLLNPHELLEQPRYFSSGRDILGWSLIVISSVLLGIWAVRGTIALRNILLGLGTLISIIYCIQFFRLNTIKIPFKNWIPLICLGLMFCWVIFHYFFLSRFPDQQFHELTSTWLRSGLAMIVGIGAGLAFQKRPNAINLLWMGILASFAYLFYQYIPKAIAVHNLFAINYSYYIYPGKISGVLAGTILMIGLLAGWIDSIGQVSIGKTLMAWILWLIGTAAPLYAYVFMFDTRNGVGLTVLIFLAGFIILLWRLLRAVFLRRGPRKHAVLFLLFFGCSIGVLGWFGMEHAERNSGWSMIWEDSKISFQVERYPNWQNPQVMGYPKNAMGKEVNASTYERLAWANAGIRIFLPENPLGVGILSKPFTILLIQKYPNAGSYIPSSHSAWVELGLAFGYPGLLLMLGSVMPILFLAINSKSPLRTLTGLLSLGLVCLYTVGEISSQHSIEILCFLVALMTALLFQGSNLKK